MAFKDLMNKVKGSFNRVAADFSRRPDGGTSCYRPMNKKGAAYGAGSMADTGAEQPITYAHTGFTGMNPPATWEQQGGYMQQGQNAAYAQNTAYAQDTAYAQGTLYGRNQTVPQPVSYQPRRETAPAENTASRPERGWFPSREEKAARDNISYMPGMKPGAGVPGVHVEHIMALTGLKSCYEAIECMKNGETLIVTLDAIANDGESMRCQDMLAGAAFTLGCSVRLLQAARVVVIAPEGVKILPEQAAPQRVQMPQEILNPPAPATSVPMGRRERRTGNRSQEWNAARNGELNGYNPYTGTMPAAAGAYGSFGGYGY